MKITVDKNEYGTNLILLLSDKDVSNLQDGSGCSYKLDQVIDDMVADVIVVRERE